MRHQETSGPDGWESGSYPKHCTRYGADIDETSAFYRLPREYPKHVKSASMFAPRAAANAAAGCPINPKRTRRRRGRSCGCPVATRIPPPGELPSRRPAADSGWAWSPRGSSPPRHPPGTGPAAVAPHLHPHRGRPAGQPVRPRQRQGPQRAAPATARMPARTVRATIAHRACGVARAAACARHSCAIPLSHTLALWRVCVCARARACARTRARTTTLAHSHDL